MFGLVKESLCKRVEQFLWVVNIKTGLDLSKLSIMIILLNDLFWLVKQIFSNLCFETSHKIFISTYLSFLCFYVLPFVCLLTAVYSTQHPLGQPPTPQTYVFKSRYNFIHALSNGCLVQTLQKKFDFFWCFPKKKFEFENIF